MVFFVIDFCKTMHAGVVIFAMQVGYDVLYCGITIEPSSLYLSDFLSFHT